MAGRLPAPVATLTILWTVCKINFDIPNNSICPITYEIIDIMQGICKCNQCNNIFGYNAFNRWITEQARNCPLCRNTNIENKYYTVSGEHIGIGISIGTSNSNVIAPIRILEPYILPPIQYNQNTDTTDTDVNIHGEERNTELIRIPHGIARTLSYTSTRVRPHFTTRGTSSKKTCNIL